MRTCGCGKVYKQQTIRFQGVNMHNLNVKDNYPAFSDVVLGRNDASYQPFIIGFTVGGEYDSEKIREIAGALKTFTESQCPVALCFRKNADIGLFVP